MKSIFSDWLISQQQFHLLLLRNSLQRQLKVLRLQTTWAKKKEYKNVKVVALLYILQKLNITTTSPKLLSEYYFVFRGSDGYAVVYSWNEIFNTDIGNSIFIVTEADNKKLTESTDRILLISTRDFKTGRRHIKGLKSIEIRRI